MELRGFSPKTNKAYIAQVSQLAKHYNKSPELLTENEIRDYLYYCCTQKQYSESHLNVIYSSLKFFYQTTLQREWNVNAIPRRKIIEKLPVILSREEIILIFNSVTNLKHKAILFTIYGGGLRISELSNLKLSDIDSKRRQILIDQGKGKKDRYTLLSNQNLEILREYYKRYKPSTWLFPGDKLDKPISARSIQRMFRAAKEKAGINKKVSVHTLRHYVEPNIMGSE